MAGSRRRVTCSTIRLKRPTGRIVTELIQTDEEISSAGLRSTRKPWEKVKITFTGLPVDEKVSCEPQAQ
jgi:hypothetical protein